MVVSKCRSPQILYSRLGMPLLLFDRLLLYELFLGVLEFLDVDLCLGLLLDLPLVWNALTAGLRVSLASLYLSFVMSGLVLFSTYGVIMVCAMKSIVKSVGNSSYSEFFHQSSFVSTCSKPCFSANAQFVLFIAATISSAISSFSYMCGWSLFF